MERKGRKTKTKKIIAILCIFVVLQSYFSYFAQIAIATSDVVIGDESSQSSDEVTVGSEEDQENQSNDPAEETQPPTENQDESVVGEQGNTDGETIVGEEPQENPSDGPVVEEDLPPVEGDEENPTEEPTEEPADEPAVEPVEEEPYVEPEATVQVTSENSSIYKGYLYANATSDNGYETHYNTIDTVTIVGGKNLNSLTVQDEPDKIGLITNTKLGLMNDTYYRQTRISVEEFNNILGEDGVITIYSPEGEIVGYINKDSVKQNNEYVVAYPIQLNSLRFELTNIKNDGTFSIRNDKTIKDTAEFARNQISLFATINTMTDVNLYEEGKEVKNYKAEGNITLEETESRMLIDTDTTTLAVEGKNEVAINVTLKTDEERYDLFENPTIDIEFPSAIDTIDVTNMSLLYRNGLSIDSWNVETNSIGRKVLSVKLAGSQIEYTPGAVTEGTTLVINTEIDVNRLTSNSSDTLKMTYSNKDTYRKTYVLNGKESEDIELGFVGRQELVRALRVTEADVATAISYDDQTEKIQVLTNKNQTINIEGSIMNNYETTLTDVVIVGRIPFVGNKDGNGNDLGTNFNTSLQSELVTNGVVADVYYSEDGKLDPNGEGWTQDLTNLSNFKSYKIVISQNTLAKGERLSFDYNLLVPESVGYNAVGYNNYVVYYKMDTQSYTNQCSAGIVTETREIELEDIEDNDKQNLSELTIGTQVSQGGKIIGETDSVYERQVLEYKIIVKNTSNIIAKNIIIKANAQNANLYYFETSPYAIDSEHEEELIGYYKEDDGTKEAETFEISELAPGETKTFSYQVIVKKLEEVETPEVFGKLKISADNVREQELTTFKNTIEKGNIEIIVDHSNTIFANRMTYFANSALLFNVSVKNISGRELRNVRITVYLPDSITFGEIETTEELNEEVQATANGTIVTFKINNMSSDYDKVFPFITNINKFDIEKESIDISVTAKAEVGEREYVSNVFSTKAGQTQSKYEYSWKADSTKETLENGDIVNYIFNLKNVGAMEIPFTGITNQIPKGLKIQEITLVKSSDSNPQTLECNEESESLYEEIDSIGVDEEITLNLKTVVDSNLFEIDQQVIENKLQVDGGESFDDFETNVITYKINNEDNVTTYVKPDNQDSDDNDNNNSNNNVGPSEQPNTNNNNNNNQPIQEPNDNGGSSEPAPTPEKDEILQQIATFGISGLAWIDSNQDGIRQSDEEMKPGIIAYLYKANNNGGIDTSSLVSSTTTNSEGLYTFTNVPNGNYIVVFDYNSEQYKVTRYQVETATTTENSDVVSKNITIKGNTQMMAVTDVLEINGRSLISIDIGLTDKTNFDLKLEKMISSVTVKNNEGTKTYDYEDVTEGRLEIRSKYYKSSVVDITYKFKITNEGDIPGYVNKVVDYLPDGVQVVLNKSEDWYIGSDNGLYYTGLVDEEIKPGETREFTLILRRSLEDGESARLVNGAEIIETTNTLELFDRDSIENNKMKTEDDYGEAIFTISVSTGLTVQYITTTLMIIIMIAVIMVIIIKIKNTKKVYR